ncbi:hypothetical protein [Bradyrhizobium sp. JYMT SZCCT0180]|uniref:hypothetical protein n=1 Tax=Bradyrhizobium sp. JYMT SZCCT0180 TaxID=2807666 RepID=UPI001BA895A6|nr:hypothetical protein [Bradyrhizobium sp. JYMT SZCCT0180]MBR1212058.1 hypothetical protein [Bradyrhizobium sp. JYMT SZCCT0180]
MKLPSNADSAGPLLPASDCDLLQGHEQMAAWRGLTVSQIRKQIQDEMIPVYKHHAGKSTVFAFKSEILSTAREKLIKVRPTQTPSRKKKAEPAG